VKNRLTQTYNHFVREIFSILETARQQAAKSVNAFLTATYWEIGRRLVEFEQQGQDRAEYGESLLKRLSEELSKQFGRGFSVDNLENMRLFYLTYPLTKISETLSRKLEKMHLYLNYACEHWTRPDENPPVGLILCTYKDAAVAKYALEGLSNKVLTSEYRTALPNEKLIAEELERTRRILEDRYQMQSLHQKSKRRLISRKC